MPPDGVARSGAGSGKCTQNRHWNQQESGCQTTANRTLKTLCKLFYLHLFGSKPFELDDPSLICQKEIFKKKLWPHTFGGHLSFSILYKPYYCIFSDQIFYLISLS